MMIVVIVIVMLARGLDDDYGRRMGNERTDQKK